MFLGYKNNKIIVVANTETELNKMNKYCQFDKIEETDKEYFMYNGEYVCEVPLDELKQAKRDEINAARDNAEQGGFEYMGKIFDSDPVSCQRIALASQTALISKQASQEFSVEWTCQDNSKILLSADDTIGLSVALTQWSNICHVKASELKALVEQATTQEEVDAINWGLDLSTEQVSEQVETEIKEEIVSEANDVIEEID